MNNDAARRLAVLEKVPVGSMELARKLLAEPAGRSMTAAQILEACEMVASFGGSEGGGAAPTTSTFNRRDKALAVAGEQCARRLLGKRVRSSTEILEDLGENYAIPRSQVQPNRDEELGAAGAATAKRLKDLIGVGRLP